MSLISLAIEDHRAALHSIAPRDVLPILRCACDSFPCRQELRVTVVSLSEGPHTCTVGAIY